MRREPTPKHGTFLLRRWVLEECLIAMSAACSLHSFCASAKTIPLTIGIAILDKHTQLACLETGTPCNATLGAAAGLRHRYVYFTPK